MPRVQRANGMRVTEEMIRRPGIRAAAVRSLAANPGGVTRARD